MAVVVQEQINFRSFGLVTGAIVVSLFGLVLPWVFGQQINPSSWPFYLAAGLALIALVFPLGLKPVYRVWMAFGMFMGAINTRLILGVLFFLVFSPFAIVLYACRWDPLARKFDSTADTYRVVSTNQPASHMERPY